MPYNKKNDKAMKGSNAGIMPKLPKTAPDTKKNGGRRKTR
jgi:hypothetical protein